MQSEGTVSILGDVVLNKRSNSPGPGERTTTVTFVQGYLPEYRIPFFQGLREELATKGIDLQVGYGRPSPTMAARNDERHLAWAMQLKYRHLEFAGRSITWRSIWPKAGEADLLVLEDAIGKLDTWWYIVSRRLMRRPVALWGHAETQTVNAFERRLRNLLRGWADWYFAYTEDGKFNLGLTEFPPPRITSVGNSIDLRPLQQATKSVTLDQIEEDRSALGLERGHTALFLGSLDGSKGLDLLVTACDTVSARDPLFKLVIIGDGPKRKFLEDMALNRPWIIIRGPVHDPYDKARAAASADVLLSIVVGLVAVDSFALETPIITTDCGRHGPEFGYLEHEVNALVANENQESFAAEIMRALSDTKLREGLALHCRSDASKYGSEKMITRFSRGITDALEAGVRRDDLIRHET